MPETEKTPRYPKPPVPRPTSAVVWAAAILCTILVICVIITGAVVFTVYLVYQPKTPYLLVSTARLGRLVYDQSGTLDMVMGITVLAENTNSKVDARFSDVDLRVVFDGVDVARLRAAPFVVRKQSAVPLGYVVSAAGRALDPAAMEAMDAALKAAVVPFSLYGRARTRWRVGIFVSLTFWTRISCRMLFSYPGNGTALPFECRSRSP